MFLDFSDYVSADDALETSDPLTDNAIIDIVNSSQRSQKQKVMTETIIPNKNPTNSPLAIDIRHQLRLYFESQPESTSLFSSLNQIEQFIRERQRECKQQTTITKFAIGDTQIIR